MINGDYVYAYLIRVRQIYCTQTWMVFRSETWSACCEYQQQFPTAKTAAVINIVPKYVEKKHSQVDSTESASIKSMTTRKSESYWEYTEYYCDYWICCSWIWGYVFYEYPQKIPSMVLLRANEGCHASAPKWRPPVPAMHPLPVGWFVLQTAVFFGVAMQRVNQTTSIMTPQNEGSCQNLGLDMGH